MSQNYKGKLATTTACALVISCVSMFAAQHAQAQTTPNDASAFNGLDEVVVTAEKHESTAQKTAAAITVITPETLERQQIVDVASLTNVLPNTQIYPISNNVQFSIRGIGSTFIDPRADPAVAASINGLYLDRTLPVGFALLDVSRVEALNGPQGTLYGRNAAAGAINIITNQPTDKLEGSVSVTGGNLGTNNVSGVLNVPVSKDLAFRVAYERDRSEGDVDHYYNDVNTDFLRMMARWTPLDALIVNVEWDHDQQGGHGSAQVPYPCAGSRPYDMYVPASCAFPFGQAYQVPLLGQVADTTDALRLQFDVDLNFATLTSITGYVITRNNYKSVNGAIFADADPNLAGDAQINQSKDFTEEMRLSGDGEATHAGGFAWVTGLFIFDSSGSYNFMIPSLGGGSDYPDLPQRSEAVFGQATYGVTDDFRLTAGLRYSHDFKGLTTSYGPVVHVDDYNINYKVGVEYQLAERNMLYADVSSGYVSGGPNGGEAVATPPPSYGPTTFQGEKVTAYEIGAKNRFLDNRVQLNSDFYYYDISNYQLFLPGLLVGNPGTANVIQNVPKVTTYGWEANGAFALTPNDQFTGSVSVAHGEFGAASLVTFGFSPTGLVGVPYPVTDGTRLLNLPNWQANLGYEHTFNLENDGSVVFAISTKLSGNYLTTVTANGTVIPADVQGAYTRTDLSLAYHPASDGYTLRAWVKNIEDANVNLYGEGAGYYLYSVLPPRTYGITLSAKF